MSKRRRSGPPFVQLHHWVLNSPAWRDLTPDARALYVELKRRFNGFNNGALGFGVREAGNELHIGKNVAARAFRDLEQHGFIVRAKEHSFNQKRLTTEWLLTEESDSRTGHTPSKDFMRWPNLMPPSGRKKQNAVPPAGHIVPPAGHEAAKSDENPLHSTTSGTVVSDFASSQYHQRDTSRYSHRQGVSDDQSGAAPKPLREAV